MKRRFALTILVLAGAAAIAVAASQRIEREGVVLRGGPGSFYPSMGKLEKGSDVELLAEKGPWRRVRRGAKAGWVSRSAFEKADTEGLRAFSRSIGSQEASATAETAAVKGFETDIERAHAEGRGQDWSALAALDRQAVSTEDMLEFLRERGLLGEVTR